MSGDIALQHGLKNQWMFVLEKQRIIKISQIRYEANTENIYFVFF